MLAVLSGGGTAGHINPALALAEVLQERGCAVRFAGTPQGVEARLVKLAGIPFQPFEAAGFDRQAPWTIVSSGLKIARSIKGARRWMQEIKPSVVVGFGGYVSVPVGIAAEKLGIPVVVHEQNSVMGMANAFLAKRARAVALTYEMAAEGLSLQKNVTVTGNPVRRSILSATREEGRAMLGIPEDAVMLLIFGGSLGARHLNQRIAAMKDSLLAREGLHVVHITGPKEYDATLAKLALDDAQRKRWHVFSYQDRMAETLAAADCVISRAGATSLAEISALRLPALLVPFPFATADHQTTNAHAYVAKGAAYMLSDDALDSPEFADRVMTLVNDPFVRESMRKAAAAFRTEDAASTLADLVCRCARV